MELVNIKTKERVFRYMFKHYYSYIYKVAESLNISQSVARYHLEKLHEEGQLRKNNWPGYYILTRENYLKRQKWIEKAKKLRRERIIKEREIYSQYDKESLFYEGKDEAPP